MLLWEALSVTDDKPLAKHTNDGPAAPPRTMRLPYDKRCAALTKAGTRCRGHIVNGGDFCLFHDPELAAKRRRGLKNANPRRRRLMHLPDGYLRKMTNIRAVGEAMDRLYREIRLGVITVEMGEVLFNILTRMLDGGLVTTGPRPDLSKAAKLRPKMSELLTRKERITWRRAVDKALSSEPAKRPGRDSGTRPVRKVAPHAQPTVAEEKPAKLRLQVAS
ncbi:MAG: hypothetical protein PVI86_16595 [Phycisphaerae bacterium]|jgi:hypothetical protein